MIYTLGESLIDIIIKDYTPITLSPGGSMLNTSINLARLGTNVSFITEIGNDFIGNYLINFLKKNNVNTDYIYKFNDGKTAISLAFLDKNSNAKYDFYKIYPTRRLKIKTPNFTSNDILAFGSYYSIQKETEQFYKKIIKKAKKEKIIIFYDPNIRKNCHKNWKYHLKRIKENIQTATIIRCSDEDLYNIFQNKHNINYRKILKLSDEQILIITKGNKGVHLISKYFEIHNPASKITPKSTIGAGDAFNAGILYSINKISTKKELFDNSFWNEVLKFGIQLATEVCLSNDNFISKKL